MDVREKRDKLEKLATLTSAQVQVMYYRCMDMTVGDITEILKLTHEGTVWSRFTQIFKKLGVSGEDELVLQYSPIFLKYIKSEEDWTNWGHIRAAMLDEAHTLSSQTTAAVESTLPSEADSSRPQGELEQTEANTESSSLSSQTSRSQQNDTEKTGQIPPRRRIPWPLVAIPLVILGLLCIAVLASGGAFLGNFLNRTSVPTTVSETSVPLTQGNTIPELSPTIQLTDTSIPLPTDMLTPIPTFTPTATLTPIPTDTKSPIGLTKGEEWSNNRVALKLKEIKYEQGRTRIGQKPIAPIILIFDFTNHSGETILLEIGPDKFRVEDSLGNQLTCDFWNGVSETTETIQKPLENEQTFDLGVFCGEGKIPAGVTAYTLYVTNFSSLPDSTWVANIPR